MAQKSKSSKSSKSSKKKSASVACKSSKSAPCKSTPCKSTTKGMKVTSRIVDVRRHTKGYVAGGKKYTVAQILKLAKSGRVHGVQVVGKHIQALPGQKRLTDLPTKVMK